VLHLPLTFTNAALNDKFKEFGHITAAKIVSKHGRSMGYGVVSYDKQDSAFEAIKRMDGRELAGKRVRVKLKKEEGAPHIMQTIPSLIEFDINPL
jgi:CUG-BP- and ETR3-like factor